MKKKERRYPLIKYFIWIVCGLILTPMIASATESKESQAPGRTMAQQATKDKRIWNTTAHSQHWTWLADPADKERQYGKAGNSLNNFCISTNKTADASCLSCHPGWGTSKDSPVNCLVCHSQKKMNFDEAVEDIKSFLEEGDEESTEIAKEIQEELKAAVQNIGLPARQNCGSCHFYGGGGDGVKHGDLDTSLVKPRDRKSVV